MDQNRSATAGDVDTGCLIEGCSRPTVARRLCGAHYARFKDDHPRILPDHRGATCSADGCGKPVESKGECVNHAAQRRSREKREREGWTDGRRKWLGATCSECDEPVSAKGLCVSHYNKANWAAGKGRRTPEENRRAHLRYRYGIDPEDYDARMESQGGVCAICKRPPDPQNTRGRGVLFVDHCHDAKHVRGLLCNDCNLIIGHGATTERLRAAIEYLEARPG